MPPGTSTTGTVRAAGGSGQGCRGQSPLHEITLVSPFPPGRALCERGRGDGGKEGKPPCGHHSGKVSQRPAPHAPHKYHKRPLSQCRRRSNARGCKGRSPLHEITLVSPFPPGRALCERGSGGWGRQSNLKAGAAGDKEGKPPAGYSGGKVSRLRKGQAPPGAGLRHPVPVPPGFSRRAPVRRGL